MKNVMLRILFLFPVLAYADSLVPQCPGMQTLSNVLLNQSGCADGNESVSNFWAISIAGSADLSPADLIDVAFPISTTSEPGVEFTGGFAVEGGNSGAVWYEIEYNSPTWAGMFLTHQSRQPACRPLRARRLVLIRMAGIDQHQSGDFSWVFGGKNPGIFAANRTTDENVGRSHAGTVQQLVQFIRDTRARSRCERRIAPAHSGAVHTKTLA